MSSDFFIALSGIERQARRIPQAEDSPVHEYLRVLETAGPGAVATYVDAAPEFEQRTGPYFILHPNELTNPSFEADLASWTEEITATGSTARDTTQSKTLFGSLASCKLVMTNSGASGQVVRRYQDVAAIAGQVWSFEQWVYVAALSGADYRVFVQWLNAALAEISNVVLVITAPDSTFVRREILNQTAPANTAWARVSVRLRSTGVGGTATAYADLVRAVKSATLRPRASRGIIGQCKISA